MFNVLFGEQKECGHREKRTPWQGGVRLSLFKHLLALSKALGAQMSFNKEPKAVKIEFRKDLKIKLGVIQFNHLILDEASVTSGVWASMELGLTAPHPGFAPQTPVATIYQTTKCAMPSRFCVKIGSEDSNQGLGNAHGLNLFLKHFLRATQKSENANGHSVFNA